MVPSPAYGICLLLCCGLLFAVESDLDTALLCFFHTTAYLFYLFQIRSRCGQKAAKIVTDDSRLGAWGRVEVDDAVDFLKLRGKPLDKYRQIGRFIVVNLVIDEILELRDYVFIDQP